MLQDGLYPSTRNSGGDDLLEMLVVIGGAVTVGLVMLAWFFTTWIAWLNTAKQTERTAKAVEEIAKALAKPPSGPTAP